MTETELAWAAGFFDGEGYVGLHWKLRSANTNPWWVLRVSIINTDRAALERFITAVGVGKIYTRKPIPNRRQLYNIQAGDRVAERMIRAIQPFSSSKRPQIDLAIKSRELGQRKPFEKIPEERWNQLREIELAIKLLNGNHHAPKTAPSTERISAVVEYRHTSI